jgi:hypothetical protein
MQIQAGLGKHERVNISGRGYKYLNNIIEQDHRGAKRLVRPGLGFGSFWTARRTLAGYEVMAMIRKGQVRNISAETSGHRQCSSPDCSKWSPETSPHPLEDDPRTAIKLCNRTLFRTRQLSIRHSRL